MKTLSKNRLAYLASLGLPVSRIEQIKVIWTKYETGIQRAIKREGKRRTLERYKASYEFLRNYSIKLPTSPIPFCKVDKRNFPKPLWPLRPLIKVGGKELRLALSIARGYEVIRLKVDLDLSTIVSEHQNYDAVLHINDIFKSFLTKFTRTRPWYLGYIQPPIQPWSKVGTTLAKGPNGPAVAMSHLDAKAVVQDTKLFESIKNLNTALEQEWITNWCVGQSETYTAESSYHTGKLCFSSEPAGKTRKFAVGDYWSQLSLKPIQLSLYRTLKGISTDATANQDKGFKSLVRDSLGEETYCFDLTAASDRIPALMQKHRLELMKDKVLADSWFSVMTERDFFVKETGESVRFGVGQPLGLLSSFPSFSLWHHDIIQLSANWENFHRGKPLRFFNRYRLLGDDVVIFDRKVAMRYQRLLRILNIDINLTKSIIGNKEHSQIEFAKRLALDGKEVSSIKHNILTKSDISSMLDLVEILRERDFTTSDLDNCISSSILKSKDQQNFEFLSWLRSSDRPTFTLDSACGNQSLTISRKEVLEIVQAKRYQNLVDKITKIQTLDMEREYPSLCRLFDSHSQPYSRTALADRSIGDLSSSHPVVLGLTQTSRELQFLMFDVLDDLDPDNVSPVEYLPIVNSKSYFTDRKAGIVFLSKILLDSFNELKDRLNLANADPELTPLPTLPHEDRTVSVDM